MDPRVGEYRNRASATVAGESRSVIEVQMGEHNVPNVARIDAMLSQCIDCGALFEFVQLSLALAPLVAAAGLDEHESVA